jgi:lipopolysaccharide biosynthesis glycosyltransferase
MVKIFVGTSANGEDVEAEMTLEYTLKKHSSEPVEITWMRQTKDTNSIWGGWKTDDWHTPFSGYRWAIPAACNFEGRAIYMDVDMICLKDISEMFNEPITLAMNAKMFGGSPQYSVILFDNAKCKDLLPSLDELRTTPDIMQTIPRMIKQHISIMSAKWNVLDGEDYRIEDIGILHYTRMATQPWRPKWFKGLTAEHSRPDVKKLWFDLRDEAKAMGYTPTIDYELFGEYDIIGM